MSALHVHLSSTATVGDMTFAMPVGTSALPVGLGVLLPAFVKGDLNGAGTALLDGNTVGFGAGAVSVVPGAATRMTIQMVAGNRSCTDFVMESGETDVDCGGGFCGECAPGKKCVGDLDCTSKVCNGGLCAAPRCLDSVQNGGETAIDCGGPDCPPCGEGLACLVPRDCGSMVCKGGTCEPATCFDGVKNGVETDVDCGGVACPHCPAGKMCLQFTDCLSSICAVGVCH